MADHGPKLTIAGYGLDISWKLWVLVIILALVFFALVAGIKVNVRNVYRNWFPRWTVPAVEEVKTPDSRWPRILRDSETQIEIQTIEVSEQ